MSITIPTYAICVSFLGRESKRTLFELDRRREDLERKTKELSSKVGTDPGLASLKAEIKEYEKDIANIRGKLGNLSAWGAFALPFACFTVALFMAGYGFAVYEGVISGAALGWGLFSVSFSAIGMIFLVRSLYEVNRAVLRPESLSSFRVSFDSGSTVKEFPVSQPGTVDVLIHNFGREMAENVMVELFIPPEFQVLPGLYSMGVQPPYPSMNYPGTTGVTQVFDDMHEDTVNILPLNIVMPPMPGKYPVHVNLWERRLGKSSHDLTFIIT